MVCFNEGTHHPGEIRYLNTIIRGVHGHSIWQKIVGVIAYTVDTKISEAEYWLYCKIMNSWLYQRPIQNNSNSRGVSEMKPTSLINFLLFIFSNLCIGLLINTHSRI